MTGSAWLRIGAISGALAVMAGAFGAHGLKGKVDDAALAVFETGAKYHMYHALAIVGVGLLLLAGRAGGTAAQVAGWGFLVGTVLFSGSLYALTITGQRWLGAITPFGGLAFIAGWLALAAAAPWTGPARGQAPLEPPPPPAAAAPIEHPSLADMPSDGAESP